MSFPINALLFYSSCTVDTTGRFSGHWRLFHSTTHMFIFLSIMCTVLITSGTIQSSSRTLRMSLWNEHTSSAVPPLARDHKGQVTQIMLAICGFDMVFYYIVEGWDGSASDSYMYNNAWLNDFAIPEGHCYLRCRVWPVRCSVGAILRSALSSCRVGLCTSEVSLYCAYCCYKILTNHTRPQNPQELYNL